MTPPPEMSPYEARVADNWWGNCPLDGSPTVPNGYRVQNVWLDYSCDCGADWSEES